MSIRPNHPVRRSHALPAILVLVLVLACSGSGAGAEAIAAACTTSTNMDKPICDCLGRKAASDLTRDERDFVLAALNDDQDETKRLRGELSLESAMKAGMFMTNAGACALEVNTPSTS